jgi:pSer/pThr/pTyr-binding forkhead associated (FHA) protein
MANVTFQVIDGVDKGVIFSELTTPITIGREEGNSIRLNDERISRFHAKIQFDQGDMILTDLESTNGTRVNGQLVHVHRLRHGDCVHLGRSVLLYGSLDDIAARETQLAQAAGQRVQKSSSQAEQDDYGTVISSKVKDEDGLEGQAPEFTINEDATVVS